MNLADEHIEQIISDNGGNFTPDEFLDDREMLHPIIVQELVAWRNWHGFSTQITSAYRTTGSHITGKAIDVLVWKNWRKSQPDPMHLWRMDTTWPFLGCGIYFDWNDGIGLHLDVIREGRQRPLRWIRSEGNYYYQLPSTGRFWDSDGNRTTLQQEINTYLANSD